MTLPSCFPQLARRGVALADGFPMRALQNVRSRPPRRPSAAEEPRAPERLIRPRPPAADCGPEEGARPVSGFRRVRCVGAGARDGGLALPSIELVCSFKFKIRPIFGRRAANAPTRTCNGRSGGRRVGRACAGEGIRGQHHSRQPLRGVDDDAHVADVRFHERRTRKTHVIVIQRVAPHSADLVIYRQARRGR